MSNHNTGLHHYASRRRTRGQSEPKSRSDKFKKFYDTFIYFIAILAPVAHIPQLMKVWIEKNSSGVSPLSWFFFSTISVTWLIYGIIHKDKHIIIMNFALMIVQALIAIGTLVYS